MKQSRMIAGSFAAVLSPFVGLAASLAGSLPARGVDAPSTQRVISIFARDARSVFATDLDGDGDTDVLSASWEDDEIAWYESDGGASPTFTKRVITDYRGGLPVGRGFANGAVSVFAADVDGDGDADVLSASYLNDKIAWYESDGGSPPSFTERMISTAADGAWSVFATDLDADGDIDVLSASFDDGKIAWYENDGGSPPTFTERVISTAADGAISVFATDVDGDGDTDVLSASWRDDKIAWYESDGGSPPSFTERVISTAANAARSVFASDLDGDGDTDVLSASQFDDTIAWHENDGGSPPTFTEWAISTTAGGATSVFATDVDGDGDIDVLSASQFDDKIAWYESDGGSPPAFTEQVISTAADGAISVFATDLDGDGDTDVLSASRLDDKIAWYENRPVPPPHLSFTERVISTTANSAESVFATDLDGDGDTDVLSASAGSWPYLNGMIVWHESDGGWPPAFSEHVIPTAARGAASVFATDLNGDGDTDILSASYYDDKIAWYESNGGSSPRFTERVISTVTDGPGPIFATDLDGDGDTDVLSASDWDDKIAWYENDGGSPPTFTERVITEDPDGLGFLQGFADGASSAFATDVDGDGDTDVLSASWNDDKIAWYESNGGSPPTFTARVISTAADGAVSVFAADMDGDGDTDVLSASSRDNKIAWYESDGASPPSFTEREISTAANRASSVFASDLDGDGYTDVLSASRWDDKIAWYESDGGSPPAFTERVISTAANRPTSVFATDVDGDGDTDVLSASSRDNKIAWYENTECGDGLVEGAEACDDGGESATCDANCTLAQCGDGTLNLTAGEECELPGRDCCDASCHFEPSGTTCRDDDDPCTDDTCVENECVHTPQSGCGVFGYLDIKPGSCPNPVNPRSNGVVSIAIVGSSSFDVTQIDVDSLTLARTDGGGGIVTPITGNHGPRVQTEDVATPFDGGQCACHELGGDGIDDLVLKFSTPELVEALELASLQRSASVVLTVGGALMDGTEFEASDCIVIPGRNAMPRKRGRP